MGARPRRRRRRAPRRIVRRWYRRQDSLTRGLQAAVILLCALLAGVFVPLLDDDRRDARPPDAGAVRKQARAPERSAAPVRHAAVSPADRARRPRPSASKAPSPPAPTPPPAASAAPSGKPATPRAAIVIDDLGQRIEHLEELVRLEIPLSIAVIPGLPATAATVREAGRRGIEMLLHQPMEPHEEGGKDAGEGVLLTSMTPQAVHEQLRHSLAAVPGAVGVNNHMGSRYTEDPAALGPLMAELKSAGLFWLDSRTSPATRGAQIARSAGVPAIERDIFIDAERDADFVRRQLRKLIETARRRGAAVGIGHPRPETMAALRELREELLSSGVALVPVSELLRTTPGGAAREAAHAAASATGSGGGRVFTP